MYNLTIPFDIDNAILALEAVLELPFTVRTTINAELRELVVLCDVRHAADVERTLAPFV